MKNKNLFLFCILLVGMHASAFAVVNCTWVGNTTANWSNPANWNTNPNLPGQTADSHAYFTNTTASAYMPFLDTAQPSGAFKILDLTFQSSGWTLGGTAPLTLDKGNVSLGTYITSNGSGTNVIECPIILGSGSSGTAVAFAESTSTLNFKNNITYTSSGRSLSLNGGGTFILNGAFIGADLIGSVGSRILLARPSGRSYDSTAGLKFRLNGASATWMYDNQISATNRTTEVRLDGNAFANLNGKSDTFATLTFAVDTTECGTLDTGANGIAYVGGVSVGTTSRIPSATAYINGNIAFGGGLYDTKYFTTRRGTQNADLVVNANISSAGSIGFSATTTPGIVVFNGTNTYAGTTKVTAGTLRVNTQGAPGISVGRVEVAAAGRLEGISVIDPVSSGSTVSVLGTLAPGDPIGTLTIGSAGSENNVAMNSGSFLEIRANASGCASLRVYGSITLSGVTALHVVAPSLPPAGLYLIASTTGTISGNFTEITGESERLAVTQSADNKQLWLRVSNLATMIIVK